MLYVLENIHWFALLIGALVFVHELGHFLVAKACGVKVTKFSLGFGPKLLAFTRGETEYRIGALPLGGYVKMLGEVPGAEIPPEDEARAFFSKPVWQRTAVAAAGPLFNFVLATVVYFAMFVGPQTFGDTKLGVVSRGDPAWNAGLRPGDRIVEVNGVAVQRWDDLRTEIGSRPGQRAYIAYERDGTMHRVEVTPASQQESNVFQEKEKRGRIGVSLQYIKTLVAVVDPQSPAALAGMKTGDRIIKVGETPVEAWHELRSALQEVPADLPIALTLQRPVESTAESGAENKEDQKSPNEEHSILLTPNKDVRPQLDASLFSSADTPWGYTGIVSQDSVVAKVEADTPAAKAGLLSGDRLLHLKLVKPDGTTEKRPIGVWGIDLAAMSGVDARSKFTLTVQRGAEIIAQDFMLEAREERDELKNTYTRYVFGATNTPGSMGTYTLKRQVGLAEAFQQALTQVGRDATLIAKGIGMLIRGRLPLDSMGGPIMLFVIAEKSAKRGWEHFLRMMAVISVNLGLLNLLPVPVLDGGHLMFFALEAIRRKPPSIRAREIANMVGLALLLMLMVLVFKNDILKYVLG